MSSMQSEMAAILIATAAKLMMYDVRVNFNLGFEVNERPNVSNELTLMAVALCVESVGDVAAMAVQKRQGVAHVSMVSGKRWRETIIFLASVSLCCYAAVLNTFTLRNVGFACPPRPVRPPRRRRILRVRLCTETGRGAHGTERVLLFARAPALN